MPGRSGPSAEQKARLGGRPSTGTAGDRSVQLCLPAASLIALRRALIGQVGPDAAARALRRAGHAAGDAVFATLAHDVARSETPDGPEDLETVQFWTRLAQFFAACGWGHLAHEPVHAGVGALDSADWVEADPADAASRPSCFFTTGLLANVLGRTADAAVGVLEVECRSRGDLRCRFLFGGAAALGPLYTGLVAGQDLDAALAALA